MKKKHVVLVAATLSLALTMGAYKSYADAATKKNAKAATESALTNTEGATQIAASGDSIVVTGDGAVAENGKVTIRKAGTYLLSGTLEEGQLRADAEEGAEIILVFDGFKISNSTDAPLLFESGSSITLVLKDGSKNAVTDLRSSAEENQAAIYTKSDLTISGNGTLDVTGTAEDAIHSKTNVTVRGGTINLKAGDDAIHADETLTILDGKVTVLESEEGLEGLVVDIQGGDITVNASDDGLNASDGSGSDKAPGQATEGAEIRISGGVLTVKAGGDGIDSNGDLIISGGTVVVDGPSDGGNAPIDYDGKGVISGGTVFVSGDSGMFQSLNDSGSTQNSIVYYLSETQAAGTKVAVADSKGNVIYENNSTTQAFNTVLFSAADLKSGENYIVTVGEQSDTVSISDTVNNIGENRNGNGPQGGMNGGFERGERPERPGKGGENGENGGFERGSVRHPRNVLAADNVERLIALGKQVHQRRARVVVSCGNCLVNGVVAVKDNLVSGALGRGLSHLRTNHRRIFHVAVLGGVNHQVSPLGRLFRQLLATVVRLAANGSHDHITTITREFFGR